MMHTRQHQGTQGRRGFVMISVLFVLLALLILTAPFLATARNANHHSTQVATRTQQHLALDSAGRHARHLLSRSHPGAPDESPWFDGLDELAVPVAFDPTFLNPSDPRGIMWDVSVDDVAGLIDLNSASPMVLANLLGMTTRLTSVVESGARDLPVGTTGGFDPDGGFLWIGGELVQYGRAGAGGFEQIQRGVGTVKDDDDKWVTEGPKPPSSHGVGSHVLDQRAFAPAIWRLDNSGQPREFDTLEQLDEADSFSLGGGMGAAARTILADTTSVYGGVRGGSRWQRPIRLITPIEGGVTLDFAVDDPRYVNAGATIWISNGLTSEMRLVQGISRAGRVEVERVLEDDYDAWSTVVRVLRKRPAW
jgi:hypothetical protein